MLVLPHLLVLVPRLVLPRLPLLALVLVLELPLLPLLALVRVLPRLRVPVPLLALVPVQVQAALLSSTPRKRMTRPRLWWTLG